MHRFRYGRFHQKVASQFGKAFHATLESIVHLKFCLLSAMSQILLSRRLRAVDKVLTQIKANQHEKIYVFNKIDKGTQSQKSCEQHTRVAYLFLPLKKPISMPC